MNTHRNRTIRACALAGSLTLLLLGLTGCNGMQHPEDFPLDGPTHTAPSNPQEVSAADFGHTWALNVDHGTVSCETNSKGDPVLRFTAPDGTDYALNSVDENSDLPPISDISDGSIGTLRTFAFTVCDA